MSGTLGDYVELTKPRLSLLVWMTTLGGYFLAPTGTSVARLAATLLGTMLVVGGANALNQVYEREIDALMRRTRGRPLPSGRVWTRGASVFGLVLAALGTLLLAAAVNVLAAALGFAGFALYVFVYTPMKRRSALCTLVGAIPGAIPPLIGWAAATNSLTAAAWALFGVLFLWQMPHFLAIARLYREDYRRAGMVMVGIEEGDGPRAYRQMIIYCAALIPMSLSLSQLTPLGQIYFFGALALGLGFLFSAVNALRHANRAADRATFMFSLAYLPLLLGLMILDLRVL